MAELTFETRVRARNLRLLFLVDAATPFDQMLDLMSVVQKKWGGRFSPIIPVMEGVIGHRWKEYVRWFDPDFVYYNQGVESRVVYEFIEEMHFNPADVEPIQPRFNEIKGLYAMNLISILRDPISFLEPGNFYNADPDLKNYFRLNYGLDENAYVPNGVRGHHKFIVIDEKEFGMLNKIIYEQRASDLVWLSTLNTAAPFFRVDMKVYGFFKLIIGKDGDCNDDLLYHWNKKLFDLGHTKTMSSLFMTRRQLDLLLEDGFFKFVLRSHAGNNNRIEVVSFSLPSEELMECMEKLKKYMLNMGVQFNYGGSAEFPYLIMDRRGYRSSYSSEPERLQRFGNRDFLVSIPTLSFNFLAQSPDDEYALSIDITEIDGYRRNNRRFPLNTQPGYVFKVRGRVDKHGRLVGLIDNGSHRVGVLEMIVPNLFRVMSDIIAVPCLDMENVKSAKNIECVDSSESSQKGRKNIHHFIQYNDGSLRLQHFFGLFNYQFEVIDKFLNDRFWHDLFLELTDNNKTEGDTITFKVLFNRCLELMRMKEYAFDGKNREKVLPSHLDKGLKGLLQELVGFKVFLPGYIVKCGHCSSKVWYSVKELDNRMICKGCSGENEFVVETPISYKLNHLVRNNYGMKDDKGVFNPDGNLTAIKTLLYLRSLSGLSFDFTSQFDVWIHGRSEKPKTDLDIVAMVEDELYIGECKNNSKLFSTESHKCLHNLVDLAKMIKPAKLIISCSENDSDKLEKAHKFLEHLIKKWIYKPEVVSLVVPKPAYFSLGDFYYFKS